MISLSLLLHQATRYEIDGKFQVQLHHVRGFGISRTGSGRLGIGATCLRSGGAWRGFHCGGMENCWGGTLGVFRVPG